MPHWADLGAFSFAGATFAVGLFVLFHRFVLHRFRHSRVFRPGFPDRYPNPDESTWTGSRTIEVGEHTLHVGVALGADVTLQRFDIRPLTEKGKRVPDDTVVVVDVYDRDLEWQDDRGRPNATKLGTMFKCEAVQVDPHGVEVWYQPPIPRRKNSSLALFATVVAKRPWRGRLGFRGWDNQGHEVKANRCVLAVIESPPESDTPSYQP